MIRFVEILLWAASIGTVLIVADGLLTLYKVVEFRAAIQSAREFMLVIGISSLTAISATLVLLALLMARANSDRARSIVVRCCLASAVIAAAVLLLNIAPLAGWALMTLKGRNYSAAWCLLVSVFFLAKSRF